MRVNDVTNQILMFKLKNSAFDSPNYIVKLSEGTTLLILNRSAELAAKGVFVLGSLIHPLLSHIIF